MRQQSWPKLAPMQGLAFLDGAAAHAAPAPPLQSWLSAARSARHLPWGAAHGHRGGGRGGREQRSVTAPPLRQPPHPVPASRHPLGPGSNTGDTWHSPPYCSLFLHEAPATRAAFLHSRSSHASASSASAPRCAVHLRTAEPPPGECPAKGQTRRPWCTGLGVLCLCVFGFYLEAGFFF